MERFTKEELEKWWHAQCPKCGWDGLSRDCAGGEPIADTGDFGDPLCPMCIKKDDYVVVDDYAEPDAQATIAALQDERDGWVRSREHYYQLWMRATDERDEMRKERDEFESLLTQRTAELEAAKRLATNAQWQIDYVLAEAKKAFDLKGHYTPSDLVDCVLRPAASMLKERDELKAELERVRGLIAALPKVEGEIEIREVAGSFKLLSWPGSGPDVALVCAYNLDEAAAYAALLQERQKLC